MVQQHCTPLGLIFACPSLKPASKTSVTTRAVVLGKGGGGGCTLLPVSIKLHQVDTMPCTCYGLLLEL